MKFNENRELWLAEKLQSQKIKTTVKIIVFAFLFVCLMLLLPPFQKMLVSISVSYASLPFTVFIFLLFALSCLYAKEISAFMENSANSKLIMVLLVCALALGLCLISIFSYIYGKQWLDSDHASEMILGKILADENVLLTTSWLYSTELRLIYQTIFTMPLFKLLGGLENWALIRSINIFLNNIVLVLSFIFMMRQFKVQLKWILITSFFLFVPFYYEYWNIVTFGGYYIFFIAQVFCGLGLFTRLVNNSSKGKKVWLEFILFLALLFALGVQGIRALYIIHIPLFVTCIYLRVKSENKTNFPLFLGCCSLAAGAVGFAVNILLSVLYNFITYEVIILEDLYSTFIVKLGQSLFNLAAFFGISASSLIFSVHGIFSIIAIFATFVLFWTACKSCRKNQFLSVFFIACTLVNLFIFIVTRRPIITRYFILFMIFYIPLTALLFEHCEKFYGYIKRIAIISAIILFVFAKGFLSFQDLVVRDTNSYRKGSIQYLSDNNLKYGFATFWNANVATELTNGKIEITGIVSGRERSDQNRFHILEYLNPAKAMDPLYHEGESFLLLTRDEWNVFRRVYSITAHAPDYEDSHFVIFRYPSAEVIHKEILGD